MTAREVLDRIEQRAIDGADSDWDPRGGDEPHHRVIERQIRFDYQIRRDARSLVAALRAVLDLHEGVNADEPWCLACHASNGSFVDYPCPTVRAVTEALGGGA